MRRALAGGLEGVTEGFDEAEEAGGNWLDDDFVAQAAGAGDVSEDPQEEKAVAMDDGIYFRCWVFSSSNASAESSLIRARSRAVRKVACDVWTRAVAVSLRWSSMPRSPVFVRPCERQCPLAEVADFVSQTPCLSATASWLFLVGVL